MSNDLARFTAALEQALPCLSETWELHAVPSAAGALLEERYGVVRITLRLMRWEGSGPSRSIVDIKEQDCILLDNSARADPDRVEAYIAGWTAAVNRVFTGGGGLDTAMPWDLVHHRVLSLVIPRRADQFESALLVRSRLGRFLPRQDEEARTPATAADVDGWLGQAFPVVGPTLELHLVERPTGGLKFVTAQAWALALELEFRRKGTNAAPPARESLALLRTSTLADGGRLQQFVLGWTAALRTVLGELPAGRPVHAHQLSCADTLKLHTARTAGDFERACLARTRLGRLTKA